MGWKSGTAWGTKDRNPDEKVNWRINFDADNLILVKFNACHEELF